MNMMKDMMIRKDTCYATNDNSAKKVVFHRRIIQKHKTI